MAKSNASLNDLDSLLAELDEIEDPRSTKKSLAFGAKTQVSAPQAIAVAPTRAVPQQWEDELDNLVAKFDTMGDVSSGQTQGNDKDLRRERRGSAYSPKAASNTGLCGQCDQPVVGEHITALGMLWHPNHFCCDKCGVSLKGDFFESDGKRVCKSCTDNTFKCDKCGLSIESEYFVVGEKKYHPPCLTKNACARCNKAVAGSAMIALGKHYHAECFTCKECSTKLGASFFVKDEEPHCESCIKSQGGSTKPVDCVECGKQLSGTYINYNGKCYHGECFKCVGCGTILPHDSFYNKGGEQHCRECAMK